MGVGRYTNEHSNYRKNGKPEWAVIPFREYKKLQEALEDVEDIKEIETNLKAIAKELGIEIEILIW